MVNLELDTSEKVKLIQGEEFIVRKVKNIMSGGRLRVSDTEFPSTANFLADSDSDNDNRQIKNLENFVFLSLALMF